MAEQVDETQIPPAAKGQIEFERDIKPILDSTCMRCHGPERPKNHFRLDNRDSALKGGENGIDILPGNGTKSPLIHYVARLVPDMEMPPEGKGTPLTPEQVGLLRAWIDQGAQWGATNVPVQTAFQLEPMLRWILVSGDKDKFREVEGTREGAGGGVEQFSIEQQLGPDKKATVEGHVLFPDNDIQLKIALNKSDVGFVHGGFEEWRKYYDDTGGYYRPFAVPSYELDRDLHLDIGRAWVDFGLTLPRLPEMVLGYEYQFKDGSKSTLEWGDVNGKNIYPASEDLHEHVHIIKFDLSYELYEWQVSDSARVEFYDLQTQHNDASTYTVGPAPDVSVHTKEGATHVQGMNTVHIERQLTDWWLLTGGYLYSRFDGAASMNQTTTDAMGIPVPGNFWSSDDISLSREAHVFSIASLVKPFEGLDVSLGVQNDWERQEGFGNINLDQGDPNVPQSFLLLPALVQSDLDEFTITENAGVRFTKIPFTVLFGEARLQQQDISQFEQESPTAAGETLNEAFLRDTDASNDGRDLRTGFNTSPWRWVSINAEYRNRLSDTDYDHLRRVVIAGPGYSAFITHRKIDDDEVQAKIVLRPTTWLKSTLSYQRTSEDYWTSTEAIPGITPGGGLYAGNYDADIYGVSLALVPFQRLHFLASFTYSDSTTTTAQNGDPSIVPYKGNIYTVTASANYTINDATSLQGSYSFSRAAYGQNNVADGLPLGLDLTHHGLIVGLTRKLTRSLTTSLRYGFYEYSEPNTGGFNDYTAQGVFGTIGFKWP